MAPQNKKGLGSAGERLALETLQKKGWRFRESNYRCSIGEMDLIMNDGDSLVFVEVKTRRGKTFGLPQEAITRTKSVKLMRVAEQYIQSHGARETAWRIDVVSVEMDERGRLLRIEHIINAVAGAS